MLTWRGLISIIGPCPRRLPRPQLYWRSDRLETGPGTAVAPAPGGSKAVKTKLLQGALALRFCIPKQRGLSHGSEHKGDPLTELVMRL